MIMITHTHTHRQTISILDNVENENEEIENYHHSYFVFHTTPMQFAGKQCDPPSLYLILMIIIIENSSLNELLSFFGVYESTK